MECFAIYIHVVVLFLKQELLHLKFHIFIFSSKADAFLLAIAGGPDLLARIQTRYFEKSKSNVARVCKYIYYYYYRFLIPNL